MTWLLGGCHSPEMTGVTVALTAEAANEREAASSLRPIGRKRLIRWKALECSRRFLPTGFSKRLSAKAAQRACEDDVLCGFRQKGHARFPCSHQMSFFHWSSSVITIISHQARAHVRSVILFISHQVLYFSLVIIHQVSFLSLVIKCHFSHWSSSAISLIGHQESSLTSVIKCHISHWSELARKKKPFGGFI